MHVWSSKPVCRCYTCYEKLTNLSSRNNYQLYVAHVWSTSPSHSVCPAEFLLIISCLAVTEAFISGMRIMHKLVYHSFSSCLLLFSHECMALAGMEKTWVAYCGRCIYERRSGRGVWSVCRPATHRGCCEQEIPFQCQCNQSVLSRRQGLQLQLPKWGNHLGKLLLLISASPQQYNTKAMNWGLDWPYVLWYCCSRWSGVIL